MIKVKAQKVVQHSQLGFFSFPNSLMDNFVAPLATPPPMLPASSEAAYSAAPPPLAPDFYFSSCTASPLATASCLATSVPDPGLTPT